MHNLGVMDYTCSKAHKVLSFLCYFQTSERENNTVHNSQFISY